MSFKSALPVMPNSTERVLIALVGLVEHDDYDKTRDVARVTVDLPVIAATAGLSVSQTQRHLRRLVELHVVQRVRGGGGAPTTYWVSGEVLRALTGR